MYDHPLPPGTSLLVRQAQAALAEVPPGCCTTYGALATELGTHGRALATALGCAQPLTGTEPVAADVLGWIAAWHRVRDRLGRSASRTADGWSAEREQMKAELWRAEGGLAADADGLLAHPTTTVAAAWLIAKAKARGTWPTR